MASRNPALHALDRLERLLPGRPAKGVNAVDSRWMAMLAIQDRFIVSHPEEIWVFVLRWAKHPMTDIRDAIACCLLEHLLEHHYDLLFPRIRAAAKRSTRFRDALRRCYWLGEAARPEHAKALDRLAGQKRPRLRF